MWRKAGVWGVEGGGVEGYRNKKDEEKPLYQHRAEVKSGKGRMRK